MTLSLLNPAQFAPATQAIALNKPTEKPAITTNLTPADSFEKVGASGTKARAGATIFVSTQELMEKAGKDVDPVMFFCDLVSKCFKERKEWFAPSCLDSQYPVLQIKTTPKWIRLETAVKNQSDFAPTAHEAQFYSDFGKSKPLDHEDYETISTNTLDSSVFIALRDDLAIAFRSENYGNPASRHQFQPEEKKIPS